MYGAVYPRNSKPSRTLNLETRRVPREEAGLISEFLGYLEQSSHLHHCQPFMGLAAQEQSIQTLLLGRFTDNAPLDVHLHLSLRLHRGRKSS